MARTFTRSRPTTSRQRSFPHPLLPSMDKFGLRLTNGETLHVERLRDLVDAGDAGLWFDVQLMAPGGENPASFSPPTKNRRALIALASVAVIFELEDA